MNNYNKLATDLPEVRDDFVPRQHYVSPEFAQQEKTDLWPRVWQMACRVEEVDKAGSYVAFEVAGYPILIVGTSKEEVKAFHNVCPHRGNKIADNCGRVGKLVCSFHGWTWDLNGKNIHIKDEKDWAGCTGVSKDEMHLKEIKVGRWGGFVFINMAPDAEPFEDFIAPVPQYLDCLEFDKMRFTWYKTMVIKGNWKTALESFMESYHVFTTHHQLTPYLDEISQSFTHGKHGRHGYPEARLLGAPSARLNIPVPDDLRANYVKVLEELAIQTGGAVDQVGSGSGRSARAARRVLTEVPASASPEEIMIKGMQFMREAAEAEGAGWPTITAEQGSVLGVDWNIFPNMVLVFALDSSLVFRSRPNGDDPHSCIFDMWGIFRYGPGKEPKINREFYSDWREHVEKIPSLLVQDLDNIEKIQAGMRSPEFAGSRLNPVQERQISNNHRVLREYLS